MSHDKRGNLVVTDGYTRCDCGSTNWRNDRCVECSTPAQLIADRRRAEMLDTVPEELRARVERGEQVWSTTELQADFTVDGFAAPFVVVRRRSDGQRGSLMFTHSPRFYFGFEPTDV